MMCDAAKADPSHGVGAIGTRLEPNVMYPSMDDACYWRVDKYGDWRTRLVNRKSSSLRLAVLTQTANASRVCSVISKSVLIRARRRPFHFLV